MNVAAGEFASARTVDCGPCLPFDARLPDGSDTFRLLTE
jgi:hypothetical protein